MTTVAVIGAGVVGRALGAGLTRAGHDVTFGVRQPDDARHGDLGPRATPAEAAAAASVVILAVPANAVAPSLEPLDLQPGQIVVDATNAVGHDVPDGHDTMGDHTAAQLPDGVHLVKAFNTIGAEHLGDGSFGDAGAFLPIGGDAEGVDTVAALATDLGHDVVVLGDRSTFGLLEAHAALWIHLAFRCGWGRVFGFVVAGR